MKHTAAEVHQAARRTRRLLDLEAESWMNDQREAIRLAVAETVAARQRVAIRVAERFRRIRLVGVSKGLEIRDDGGGALAACACVRHQREAVRSVNTLHAR